MRLLSTTGTSHASFNFSFSGNPWIRHISAADPDAHVWNNTVWVFCSMDANLREKGLGSDASTYEYMDGYHVFSSTDMVDWIDHGEIFHSRDVSWGGPGWMWAPSAHWNGKSDEESIYYLFFPHQDWDGIWRIGVATAPSPGGPYTDIGAPIDQVAGIDPKVFIDDDGQAYLYYNSAMVVKLKENMIEVAETPRAVDYGAASLDENFHFEEGSFVHKRNGIYYYSYSNWRDQKTTAYYGMGTSPYGPFEWKGALSGRKSGSQDHHSIVLYESVWFYFFHRDTHEEEKKLLEWYGQRRISCYEKMNYNSDGTIKQVDPTAWALNAGGSPHTTSDGTEYHWDQWFTFDNSQTDTQQVAISGTKEDALYQTYRFGSSFSYDIPLANGEYEVIFRFAELFHASEGERLFNVAMEGQQKIGRLDVFAIAGMNAAYDEVHTVFVRDHELNIEFSASVDTAMIAALSMQRNDPKPDIDSSSSLPTVPPSKEPSSTPQLAYSATPELVSSETPQVLMSTVPSRAVTGPTSTDSRPVYASLYPTVGAPDDTQSLNPSKVLIANSTNSTEERSVSPMQANSTQRPTATPVSVDSSETSSLTSIFPSYAAPTLQPMQTIVRNTSNEKVVVESGSLRCKRTSDFILFITWILVQTMWNA